MPRPYRLTATLDAPDSDGIADGVASTGAFILTSGVLTSGHDTDGIVDGGSSAGTSLTLNGVLTSNSKYKSADGKAHRLYLLDTATVNQSGATFNIKGVDANNKVITEALTGPASGAAVVTSNLFKEVHSVTIASPAACGTVDFGPLGVYTAVDGLGHQINIIDTATVDQSGATFTVYGTDVDGYSVSEAITGPGSGATVESSTYFKTITKIDISSGAACGTVDIGTVDEVVTKAFLINRDSSFEVGLGCVVTGTINFKVQHTFDNIMDPSLTPSDWTWFDHSSITNKTSNSDGNYDFGLVATRMTVNSYSSGATIKFMIIQGD